MSEWEFFDENLGNAKIKVFGVGGGGGNAVKHMIDQKIEGADFISINTDKQALDNNPSPQKLILGENITNGMGAGADPEIGRLAALEDKERLKELIKGADMVFIASGMGGGTGTGASPIVAQVAKELGALTVAIVTKPFSLEGKRKMSLAQEGINQMVEEVDSLITIPNQKLLEVLGKGCTMVDGFKAANDVLAGAVRGISDIIIKPGMINVDFADVKTVMSEKGTAMMGTGSASGPNRAMEAAEQAMGSKLLEDIDLKDAKGILLNITAGENLTIEEFEIVGNCVQEYASEEAIIVPGTVIDEASGDTLTVTVVATGLASKKEKQNATTNKINFLETKRELPLSSASKQIIENPPNIEMLKQLKGNQSQESEEELLDIPSFMRSQID
jgi:cell division protein FtsZ